MKRRKKKNLKKKELRTENKKKEWVFEDIKYERVVMMEIENEEKRIKKR